MDLETHQALLIQLLDRMSPDSIKETTKLDSSSRLERYIRIHGPDVPNSQFLSSIASLSGTSDEPMRISATMPNVSLEESEIASLVETAKLKSFPKLLASWAFCGPSSIRSAALDALMALGHRTTTSAICLNLARIESPSEFSNTPGKKALRAAIRQLAKSSKTLPTKDLPTSEMFAVVGKLSGVVDRGIIDALVTAFFPKSRLTGSDITDVSSHVDEIRKLVTTLPRQPSGLKTARGSLMAILAICPLDHADHDLWAKTSFVDVHSLASMAKVKARITSEDLRETLVPILREAIKSADLPDGLRIAAYYNELPADTFLPELMERALGRTRDARMFRQLAETASADRIEKTVDDKVKRIEQEAESRVRTAEERAQKAEDLARQASLRASELHESLAESRKDQVRLLDYEKTQARLDVIHELIDFVERLRAWVGVPEVPLDVIPGIVRLLDKSLDSLGVEVVGIVGRELDAEHDLFDTPDRNPSDLLVVSAPAYRLKSNVASVFRRGLAKGL